MAEYLRGDLTEDGGEPCRRLSGKHCQQRGQQCTGPEVRGRGLLMAPRKPVCTEG